MPRRMSYNGQQLAHVPLENGNNGGGRLFRVVDVIVTGDLILSSTKCGVYDLGPE